jgi:hypothetical protein
VPTAALLLGKCVLEVVLAGSDDVILYALDDRIWTLVEFEFVVFK